MAEKIKTMILLDMMENHDEKVEEQHFHCGFQDHKLLELAKH
jgi:hypothetical protein